MTNLPSEQLSESQRLATKLPVEPNTKVMQSDLGRQAGLKAVQGMGTLARQAEGVVQLVINGLDDLAQPCQPAPPGLGPLLLAALMRRTDHLDTVHALPVAMHLLTGKALVGDVDPFGRRPDTAQTLAGKSSGGKKGFGQRVVIATGRGKAKAGNNARRTDGGEQMKALIPAHAVAPADIGLPGQPATPTPFGITGGYSRTIQGFVEAVLGLHLLHQIQSKGHDHLAVAALQPIELLTFGQGGKSRLQVALGIAVKGPFTGELPPLPKNRQGHHLATRQRGDRPWP